MMDVKNNKKVLVIGVDGGNWPLINDLIKEGLLPNIAKLKEKGATGFSKSCLPPVTCVAWQSYASGKNLGKIGNFFWKDVSMEEQKFVSWFEKYRPAKQIWDYLSEQGLKCYVLNIPTTYPAYDVNGVMVSGPPAPNLDKAIYPSSLKEKLKNYKNFPKATFKVEKEKVVDEIYEIIKNKCSVVKDLVKNNDWDFFQFNFFLNDDIQHFYWKYYLGLEKWTKEGLDPLRKIWQLIDQEVGEIIELVRDKKNINIILLSDHGFGQLKANFYINNWLKEKGYLVLKQEKKVGFIKEKFTLDKIGRILNKIGVYGFFRNYIPSSWAEKFLNVSEEGYMPKEEDIDWGRSRVITLGEGPVYINKRTFSSRKEKDIFVKEFIKELEDLKDVKTDANVINKIYKKEEIYKGEFIDIAPDLMLLPSDGFEISGRVNKGEILNYSIEHWSGCHRQDGFFIALGEDIKKEKNIRVNIIDWAPTILSLFDLAIPQDIDGKVIGELVGEEQKNLSDSKIQIKKDQKEISQKEINEINKELKSLGYL